MIYVGVSLETFIINSVVDKRTHTNRTNTTRKMNAFLFLGLIFTAALARPHEDHNLLDHAHESMNSAWDTIKESVSETFQDAADWIADRAEDVQDFFKGTNEV